MPTTETDIPSSLGRNIMPVPTPIDTTEVQMLQRLKDGGFAIGYALEYLEPFEVPMFLTDWWNKADMKPWLSVWLERHGYGTTI